MLIGPKKDKGFTIIELLVVTSIILFLTALVLPNYRAGERQFALQRSAQKLAQDIRRAQEMAMSAREYAPGQIPFRYGVYSLSPATPQTSYQIFADRDDDGRWSPPPDITIETLYYENGVYFTNISGIGCTGSWPSAGRRRPHLTFKSPDPKTELQVGWSTEWSNCSEIIMTLRYGGAGGPTKSVRINKAGLIYVE